MLKRILFIILVVVFIGGSLPVARAEVYDTTHLYFPVVRLKDIAYAPVVYANQTQFSVQPPQPDELKQMDAALFGADGLSTKMATWQDNYTLQKPLPHQLLWTHSAAPDALTPQDYLDLKPVNGEYTARQIFIQANIDATIAARFRADIYEGRLGNGWVLIAETIIQNTLWRREENHGPEYEREKTWTAIQSTAPITITK